MIKSELFMGRSISPECAKVKYPAVPYHRDNYYVSDREIDDFLSDVVTIRFPGYTVLSGQGHWKGGSEDVIVLVIVHDKHVSSDVYCDDEVKIERIINEYKAKFHQESVLWLKSDVEIASK